MIRFTINWPLYLFINCVQTLKSCYNCDRLWFLCFANLYIWNLYIWNDGFLPRNLVAFSSELFLPCLLWWICLTWTRYYILNCTTFYGPQTKSRKGNVFTSVCQEFCPRGKVYTPWADTPQADTPPGQTPPRQTPPPQADTPHRQTPPRQMATAADGTHPTGMHSCCLWIGKQLCSWRSYKYLR